MSEQQILCTSCRHYKSEHIPSCRCSRKGFVKTLVDGKASKIENMLDPYEERREGIHGLNRCGKKGRYFEPESLPR